MEEVDKVEENVSFLNYMLKFDDAIKNDLSNITQYSVLAIVPVIALNKFMKHYIPKVDEDKGSLEIAIEIVLQVLVLFFGLFFIHRFVVFFKPYSGKEYSEFSIISIVLAVLLITLSIQSKLSEKANLLVERLHDLWHGETTLKEEKKPKKKVIAEKPQVQQTPTVTKAPAMVEQPTQELPNYNMMYHNTAAPEMPQEETFLMAANEALGGSSFGNMY
jgi:hypothetical protein